MPHHGGRLGREALQKMILYTLAWLAALVGFSVMIAWLNEPV